MNYAEGACAEIVGFEGGNGASVDDACSNLHSALIGPLLCYIDMIVRIVGRRVLSQEGTFYRPGFNLSVKDKLTYQLHKM